MIASLPCRARTAAALSANHSHQNLCRGVPRAPPSLAAHAAVRHRIHAPARCMQQITGISHSARRRWRWCWERHPSSRAASCHQRILDRGDPVHRLARTRRETAVQRHRAGSVGHEVQRAHRVARHRRHDHHQRPLHRALYGRQLQGDCHPRRGCDRGHRRGHGIREHGHTSLANECSRARPEWIWCDDFDTDRLARYFEYARADGRFTRSSGVGNAGSYGMKAVYSTAAP